MISSVNLSAIPFQSNTDSTRLQMSAKQLAQSLTHKNCEIPYVIGKDHQCLANNSPLGLCKAEDDGEIHYNRDDIMIFHYKNLDKIITKQIPPIRRTHGMFGSSLRSSLPSGTKFSKGDILFEYDCFNHGIPSSGYNVFTGFFPAFGYNHEDSILMSDSLSHRMGTYFVDKVYIPVYEYSLFQKMYPPGPNSLEYFPTIGERISDSILCTTLTPKVNENFKFGANTNIKNKMLMMLKTMNLSDLISINNCLPNMNIDKIKSKIESGKVTGIKIHKLNDTKLLDKNLQLILDKLYSTYAENFVDAYRELELQFGTGKAKEVMRTHYAYREKEHNRGKLDLKNVIYLLEFEVADEHFTHIGDKICNRYANKGINSLVYPQDIAPIAVNTGLPIDLIFNPFGVFSRMNLGQLVEGIVGKNVMQCDRYIKTSDCKNIQGTMSWLNEYVIKNLNNKDYYNEVNGLITRLKEPIFRQNFIDDVKSSNLYIEAPTFGEINVKEILNKAVDPNEPVLIKKEFLLYMKENLKCNIKLDIADITLPNIFCAPMYIGKLYKLANKLITARDLGSVKSITGQPTRGRAAGGGSRIGQMEIEGLIAHGCERALKEFLTVKSDQLESKRDLIMQLVKTGDYVMRDDKEGSGRTKKVVDTLLNFLRE